MKRYDLRHYERDFTQRLLGILKGSKEGEVVIFLFQTIDNVSLRELVEEIGKTGCDILNSLRFNEVDWTMVVKVRFNAPVIVDICKKYGVSLQDFENGQTTLFMGTLPSKDDESAVERVCQNVENLIYFSPMEDSVLREKASKYIKYEAGSEAGVLALLAKSILHDEELPNDVRNYLDELDEGYLSAESNVGEEEMGEIVQLFKNGSVTLLIGKDIEDHFDLETIIALIALISRFKDMRVSLLGGDVLNEEKNSLLPPKIGELKSFDGTTIYFYPFKEGISKFYGSSQFAIAAKIQNNDEVVIISKDGEYKRVFELSSDLKGTIAVLGTDKHSGFRYESVKIKKVSNG